MKVSDYVVQFLSDQGIKHVFVITGGGSMYLNESLGRCKCIQSICNSHEQACAICAENYGKATNRLGVAMVTTGPGGTNTVTGIAGAWLDSTPTLFIAGQVKRSDRMFDAGGKPLGMRQLGVQEIDMVSIIQPITKYAVTVLDPQNIRYEMEKAVHTATTGRPGPVWVEIPLDVQAAPIDIASLRGFDFTDGQVGGDAGSTAQLSNDVQKVIEALNKAERPLLFAGNGIRLARGEKAFTELVRLLKIPVVATWCAADLISSDDPLYVGRPGGIASRGANFALQNCDFLLAIGVRLDFAITGYAPEKLARGAQKVTVDIDAAELRKLEPHIQQPIQSDARVFIEEMLKQRDSVKPKDRSKWDARCADWKTRYSVVTDEHRKPEGRVSIYHLAEVIGTESRPDDLLISGSSGTGIEIFLLACPTRTGQRIYHTAGLGSMGFGLPGAIAICLAGGGRRTVCVDGDGGFQFNIQELETVKRLNLPIKFFILNNEGYASNRNSQTVWFGEPVLGCDSHNGVTIPNISKVAQSYGIQARVIEDQSNLRADVRSVLELPGPVVCDVHVIPDEIRAPRLSNYQKPDGTIVSRPLEDLWPFLPREEFLANMIVEPLPE
ncbi:MAG: thiamine pyrophosphate-binding protein [Acidobacteriaceae bacterium]|nr:thiamine pyrophosphate-binding protein [Acidobacteriaceae bacterium]